MSQAKERPILFSGPMVRALLDGRKTVTRRALSARDLKEIDCGVQLGECHALPAVGDAMHPNSASYYAELSRFGLPGDRLWVRESGIYGQLLCPDDPTQPGTFRHDVPRTPDYGEWWIQQTRAPGASYNVRGNPRRVKKDKGEKAVPSIHMPRWACRILLEITDVRLERLWDGEGETSADSRYLAEGLNRIHHGDGQHYFHPFKNEPGPGNWVDPFDAWRELWVSINGAESWNANPWVWVVEFKVVGPGDTGCDYHGSHFGAPYPDAQCVDGFLWDEDSCDVPGGPLLSGGDIPCPKCNAEAYADHQREMSQ